MGGRLRQSVTGVLAMRIAALLVVYSLCRLLFYVAYRDLFPQPSTAELATIFFGGLRFDVAAVLYTNFLFLHLMLLPLRSRHTRPFRLVADGLFVACNGLAFLACAADMAAFPHTLKRASWDMVAELWREPTLGHIVARLAVAHWQAPLLWGVLLALLVLLVRLTRLSARPVPRGPLLYYGGGLLLLPAASVLVIVGCRGGFFEKSHRPINNSTAAAYVDEPEHTALVLNTPFSLIRTIDKEPLPRLRYFSSEKELAAVYDPVHRLRPAKPGRRVNVVLFVLESFSSNSVGYLTRHLDGGTFKGYTPFLDSLAEQCRVYPNAFANGLHSIEALPSVLAGLPYLRSQFVVSPYSQDRIEALPALLATMGYRTALFHGAPNGSMGFDAFGKLAGVQEYYGMREYGRPQDFDGSWGIWDEELFLWTARRLDRFAQPFFATIYSLSSHTPYRVPERYRGVFPSGPSTAARIIGYTDYALRRFFERAREAPWYRDTLFIIVADHARNETHREFRTTLGVFRMPMLLCDAGNPELGGVDPTPVQQTDIMPTVLSYVGFRGDFVAFGKDMLDPTAPPVAAMYRPGGTYVLVEGDTVLLHDGKNARGLYRYTEDRLLEHDLRAASPQVTERLLRRGKAVLQQFNNRMREDRLTARPARELRARASQ